MIRVKAKKDLIDQEKTKCFTKGKSYIGEYHRLLEYVTLTNDNGDRHTIGQWNKHFKII